MILPCSSISWLIMVSDKEAIKARWYLSIDPFNDIYIYYRFITFYFRFGN